jgi:hypothetical protein
VYRIIHVEQDWIVCEGQVGIIKFDRKAAAMLAVHDAKELLHRIEPVESKPGCDGSAAIGRIMWDPRLY